MFSSWLPKFIIIYALKWISECKFKNKSAMKWNEKKENKKQTKTFDRQQFVFRGETKKNTHNIIPWAL